MLYEMLCGRVPFEGENVFAVLNQHITQDPPSIRQFNPDISAALATVVMHAIRRDSDKRYKSMRAMLDDLTHLDKITPVPYKPVAPQMDTTKRQIILGLIITGAILVIIIAIGVLAQVLHNVVR